VAISRRPNPSCGRRPTKRARSISPCDASTGGDASARGWRPRSTHARATASRLARPTPLPAGSLGTSPLTRRLACGRSCCLKASPLCSDPQGSDRACAAHLRNVALESSCPALTKATAVRSSHLLQQPSHELAIPLDPEPLALRSTRNRLRTAVQGCVLRPLCAGPSRKQPP
jgi:hypothetical protein